MHSNTNSFPMCLECVKSFLFLILAFESKNIPTRRSQTTCYFEHFLEPRIWEIGPDCIKKVMALRI